MTEVDDLEYQLDESRLESWEQFGEQPRGEIVEVAYIGKTRKFDDHQMQVASGMVTLARKRMGFLSYHVPLNMRGKYLVGDKGGLLGEKVVNGYAICTAVRVKPENSKNWKKEWEGKPCRAKAMNHSGLCSNHGGALNPLDRKEIDWELAPREVKWHYGKLPIDELDDEELARGQLRRDDGTFTEARFVPTQMHDAMVKRLFERADQRMREGLMDMVDTMIQIATSPVSEDADRLRAAEFVFKWLRGNQPVKVEIGMDKPFEQVMNAIIKGGSRSESRLNRGYEDDEDLIDGEIVDDLDLPMLQVQGPTDAGVIEAGDEEEDNYDYLDPRDRSVERELEPKPVVHIGGAGKPTHDIPSQPDQRHQHWVKNTEHEKEAQLRRDKLFKRKPSAAEIAEARKEKQLGIRKELAKRKALKAQGFTETDTPMTLRLTKVVNADNEDVSTDEIFSDEDFYDGDQLYLNLDVSRVDATFHIKPKKVDL